MRRSLLLLLALILILACQIIPTPPPLRTTPAPLHTATRLPASLTPAVPSSQPVATQIGPENQTAIPGELAPFPYDASLPFADIQMPVWSATPLSDANQVTLPFPIEKTANPAVVAGLTSRQRALLSQNGFVMLHSQEAQFSALRERVSLRYGQPYLLTTDAASHALRLALARLIPALEREEIHRRLLAVLQATLDQIMTYVPLLRDADLEAEARQSVAYLAVAVRLLDSQAVLDPELEALIQPQVEQVLSANGVQAARLFPDFQDDFRAYRPTGHYTLNAELQAYFRAMTWLARVRFSYSEAQTGLQSSRIPLLVTLALRQAVIGKTPAAAEWARINETLNYLSGPNANASPAAYAVWMDQIYGRNITLFGLTNASRWETFLAYIRDLPVVQANPAYAMLPQDAALLQSWSFLGARFNLEEVILQSLDAARADISADQRLQPGGLEMMAVLGSPAASQVMQSLGETTYRTNPQEISHLHKLVEGQSPAQWDAASHGIWLEAVQSLLANKSQSEPAIYPAFMRTPAWAYKDLNSALASWVELCHDSGLTVLPPALKVASKASDQPASPAAPAYVEPNPLAFYRLSHLGFTFTEGLKQRQMLGVFSSPPDPAGLNSLSQELFDLADRLQRLGDIAAKELSGQSLTASDYVLIQAPLGALESFAVSSQGSGLPETASPEPVLPAIVGFKSIRERVVQAGIGPLDRLYVLAPLDGQVYIVQGGVYSYYEFTMPEASRLDDAAWRWLFINEPPEPPVWAENLYLSEGYPLDALAFRSGDIFRIKLAAEPVTIYAAPRLGATAILKLRPGDRIKILAGPLHTDAMVWWKVQLISAQPDAVQGWLVEDQQSFERVWNQN